MPDSFFVLSKEYLELARDEVISIAKTYDRFAKTQILGNVVIVQSSVSWQKITSRATFVKISGQVLKKLSSLFLDEQSFPLLLNAKTFACKAVNLSNEKTDVTELEKSMGSMIEKFSKAKVDLDSPEIIVYLIFTDSEGFFGFSSNTVKQKRPEKVASHPHELDWKLCRAMINLAGLKEGDTVCDPFCGTGTTLLEAESMGINAIGIDFDDKMCVISKKNVESNGYKSRVTNADYTYLEKIMDKFDGLVTDLPYGRGSKTSETPDILLKNFIKKIPKRKKVVVMYKKQFEGKLEFVPAKRYDIYRHKSLTRTILVK